MGRGIISLGNTNAKGNQFALNETSCNRDIDGVQEMLMLCYSGVPIFIVISISTV